MKREFDQEHYSQKENYKKRSILWKDVASMASRTIGGCDHDCESCPLTYKCLQIAKIAANMTKIEEDNGNRD